MPWFWIVAGVNGAGKTTMTRQLTAAPRLAGARVINPDDIALALYRETVGPALDFSEIDPARLTAVNVDAASEAMRRLLASLDEGRTVLVETVLSTQKYEAAIARARAAGYGVGLTYIFLSSAQLAMLRVAQRVAAGGHDVPSEKIVARYHRSLEILRRWAAMFDLVDVRLNDDEEDRFRRIACFSGGAWRIEPDCPAAFTRALIE